MICSVCSTECHHGGKFCGECGNKFPELGANSSSGPKFEDEIFSRDIKEDINIVVLGKSGIGKSTWVNSFFNFLTFESFESALKEKIVYAPIYTQFNHADMTIETDCPEERLRTIEVGEKENLCDEYAMGNVTASSTMMPVSHVLELKNAKYVIRLIDTPGIKSTVGKGDDKTTDEVDKSNINMILDHISQYPYINAFVVMLKPDEEKLDPTFASIIKTLFGQLGESARKNVVFAFTHSRNCDFQDTKTVSVLSKYLKLIELDIKIKDLNVFYFDSSPFRYLATISQGHNPKEDRCVMKVCWNKSVKSCRNMIKYVVEELEKHDTSETLAVSDAKRIIEMAIEPVVRISKINEENIAIVKKAFEDLALEAGLIVYKTIDIREKVLTFKTLDKPLTVCINRKCCEMQSFLKDGQKSQKNLHYNVCCKDCTVPFVLNEVAGSVMLFFCSSMEWGGDCKVCKHSRKEHMHIFYEMHEAERLFKMKTKDIGKKKEELEKELEIIVDTLAFFSKYLECHSMIKDYDVVDARIEEQLTKAHLELGRATKLYKEAEKKVQEYNLSDKMKIKDEITDYENKLLQIIEKKDTVKGLIDRLEIWKFRSQIQYGSVSGFSFNTIEDEVNINRLKSLVKGNAQDDNEEDMKNEDYFNSLKAKEDSLKDVLKQREYHLQLSKDFEDAHQQFEDKSIHIIGLEKIQRKYQDKLTQKRNDLTPVNVTKRLEVLRSLKHNGEFFRHMYDKINQRRSNDMVKKQKHYKWNGVYFQNFLPLFRKSAQTEN